MGFMKKRRTVAWLLAVAVGLSLVPAVDAMASAKSEKKQNAAIAKVAKATAKVAKSVKAVSKTVGGSHEVTRRSDDEGHRHRHPSYEHRDGRGACDLDGRQRSEDGLTLVGTKLAEAGAGLQKLGDACLRRGGVRRAVCVGPTGAKGVLPGSGTTPTFPTTATPRHRQWRSRVGRGRTWPGPAELPDRRLTFARSARRKPTVLTGDPARLRRRSRAMKCGGGPLAGNCDLDPTGGTSPAPPGTVLCVVGPPPTQSIDVPGVGATPFNLVTIQEGGSDRPVQAGQLERQPGRRGDAVRSVVGPLASEAGARRATGQHVCTVRRLRRHPDVSHAGPEGLIQVGT